MFSKNRFDVLSEYSNREIARMLPKKKPKEMDPPIEVKSPEEIQQILERRSSTKELGNAVWSTMPTARRVEEMEGSQGGKRRSVSFIGIPEAESDEDLQGSSTGSITTQYGSFNYEPAAEPAAQEASSASNEGGISLPEEPAFVKRGSSRRQPPSAEQLAAAEAEYAAQFGSQAPTM